MCRTLRTVPVPEKISKFEYVCNPSAGNNQQKGPILNIRGVLHMQRTGRMLLITEAPSFGRDGIIFGSHRLITMREYQWPIFGTRHERENRATETRHTKYSLLHPIYH